jgi:SAM-dependent methyltransferase
VKLPDRFAARLRCPRCTQPLDVAGDAPTTEIRCARCFAVYPIVNGTPIVIDSERSVFRADEIAAAFERQRAKRRRGALGRIAWAIASATPHVPSYRRHEAIVARFAARLATERPAPSILVAGSGTGAIGDDAIRSIPGANVCELDVYLTDARMLAADLVDVPFSDASFDAVVVQGVLEHVIDPQRAVDEIHRVLAPGGLVFSTTPFVLGVHLPVHDYTRFSRLGLIRLFRRFTPLECDVIEGAAVSLAYSIAYFWMAFWSSFGWRGGATLSKYAANYLIFWLRLLDAWVRRSPVSVDAASSYYYIGRRSDTTLADREIAAMFIGVGLCPW